MASVSPSRRIPHRVRESLDRHAKQFLMGATFERAATVGFRCAYDATDTSVERERELIMKLALIMVLFVVSLLAVCLSARTVFPHTCTSSKLKSSCSG